MYDGGKRILTLLTGRKKRKAWNKLEKNICRYNRQGIILQRGIVRRIFWQ